MASSVTRRGFLKQVGAAGAFAALSGPIGRTTAFLQDRMVLYAALDQPTLDAIISAFEEQTGIGVDLVRGGAGEMAARIRAEAGNPQGDAFIGGSIDVHAPLALEGLLAQFTPPNADRLPDEVAGSPLKVEGASYGWFTGVLGWVLNTDLFESELAPQGATRPATWDDALLPVWAGQISTSNPATSGGAFIWIATHIFRFERNLGISRAAAEELAFAWFQQLRRNDAMVLARATEPITFTAQGQTILGMSWAHDILSAVEAEQPVELLVPADTGFEIGGASVIGNGPNAEAAQEFVNFVIAPDGGQEINSTVGVKRYPVSEGVSQPTGAPPFDSFSLVQFDRQWAIENNQRLVDRWSEEIG